MKSTGRPEPSAKVRATIALPSKTIEGHIIKTGRLVMFAPAARMIGTVATENRWLSEVTVIGMQLEPGARDSAAVSEIAEKIAAAVGTISYALAAGAGIGVAAVYGGEMESWRAAASGGVIGVTGWALTSAMQAGRRHRWPADGTGTARNQTDVTHRPPETDAVRQRTPRANGRAG